MQNNLQLLHANNHTKTHPVTASGVGSVSLDRTVDDNTATVILKGNTQGIQSVGVYNSVTGQYDYTVESKSGGKSSVVSFSLPHPMKSLNGVCDDYTVNTGVDNKRITDLLNLGGDRNWYISGGTMPTGYKTFVLSDFNNGVSGQAKIIKYNGTPLTLSESLGDPTTADSFSYYIPNNFQTRIGVSNNDSGFSDAYAPSQAEIKAYFNGWKMCNSDGSSPYYKSEIPYNQTTWAGWGKTNAVGDSTGMELTANGTSTVRATIPTYLKPSTTYGVLLTCVSTNASPNKFAFNLSNQYGAMAYYINTSGTFKYIFTTAANISSNFLDMGYLADTAGKKVKFKDIGFYELPTGSQIKSDFNTLTIDQLNIKYPFYGLCQPYYKRIVDGTGLTSTLPTASYFGWTPYRMMYEYATPITTQYTPQEVKTFYPHTEIVACEDSEIKPTIEVTAKQIGL